MLFLDEEIFGSRKEKKYAESYEISKKVQVLLMRNFSLSSTK